LKADANLFYTNSQKLEEDGRGSGGAKAAVMAACRTSWIPSCVTEEHSM
jgi:hypothetical protein